MSMGNPHMGEMADGEDPRVKPEDDVRSSPRMTWMSSLGHTVMSPRMTWKVKA